MTSLSPELGSRILGLKNTKNYMLTAIETMEIKTGSFSLSIEKNVGPNTLYIP